jgi:general secretion pathway protein A
MQTFSFAGPPYVQQENESFRTGNPCLGTVEKIQCGNPFLSGEVMSREALLPFLSIAATIASKSTATSRRGFVPSRPAATPSPLSIRDDKSSGETEFPLHLFGVKQDPFSEAPDSSFFYTNTAIRRTYRELIHALAETPGIAVLTGEGGTGKTILLHRLCSELRAAGHLVIERCRGGLVFDELMDAISAELNIPEGGAERSAWRHGLRAALERNKGARPPVVVIDDGERLGGDVVANLAQVLAGPADCSLRILLCGRPELVARLELPALAELRRMISVVCRLERMDDDDAASYVFHRLRRAGHRGTTLFAAAAVNTVVAKSAGLPRRINQVCAQSLIVAAAASSTVVTSEMVERAVTQLMPKGTAAIDAEPDAASSGRYGAAITLSLGVSMLGAVLLLYASMGHEHASEVKMQSGNTELILPRSDEPAQLRQSVQRPSFGPLPAESSLPLTAREPALESFLQAADPCRDALETCSNSAGSAYHGDTADVDRFVPVNELPDEPGGEGNSGPRSDPIAAAAEQRSSVPTMISRAQSQLEAGHIASPVGDNAVETYRQLLAVAPESIQIRDLLEQIRLALWARARTAVKDGKWEQARRFYELAVHPAIDIEDGEPFAEAATQHVDTEVAAFPEPVLSADPTQGARAADPAAPAATGNTETLDQPKPEQVLEDAKETAGETTDTAVPAQANDDGAVVPATETAAPAQSADSGQPVGAGTSPKDNDEGSEATVAKDTGQQESAPSSDSPPAPNASPPGSAAPALAPAVAMPAPSPIPAEIVAVLIKRGDELLKIGDISGARLAYGRVAEAGNAGAMTALGTTYDPNFLNRANAIGIRPDPAKAAEWYRKAASLGDAAAVARISQLAGLAKYE